MDQRANPVQREHSEQLLHSHELGPRGGSNNTEPKRGVHFSKGVSIPPAFWDLLGEGGGGPQLPFSSLPMKKENGINGIPENDTLPPLLVKGLGRVSSTNARLLGSVPTCRTPAREGTIPHRKTSLGRHP